MKPEPTEPAPTAAVRPSTGPGVFAMWWALCVVGVVMVVFPLFTFSLLNWHDDRDARWTNELWTRKVEICRRVPAGNRLLVLGGSSVVFGVDAELMEWELGVPVVNLGTHAGLGVRYMLSHARQVAQRGDTVVLHLEPPILCDKGNRLKKLERRYAWTYDRGYLLGLPPALAAREIFCNPLTDYVESWQRWDLRLSGKLFPGEWVGYPFATLGPRGDLRRQRIEPKAITEETFTFTDASKHVAAEVDAFTAWCAKNGVGVIAVPPVMREPGESERQPNLAALKRIAAFYRSHGIPFIGEPDSGVFPAEFMLDSNYHLTLAGRRLRTQLLIDDLLQADLPMTQGAGEEIFLVGQNERPLDPRFVGRGMRWRSLDRDGTVQSQHHLGVISLGDAARAGANVFTTDPLLRQFLGARGWRSEEFPVRLSLFEWTRRYPNHLFVIASVPDDANAAPQADPMPTSSRDWLPLASAGSCSVAILGNGLYKRIHLDRSGQQNALLELSAQDWARFGFQKQLRIAAVASGGDRPQCTISVEGAVVVSVDLPGIAIAAIDPGLASVVGFRSFPPSGVLTAQVWQLRPDSR